MEKRWNYELVFQSKEIKHVEYLKDYGWITENYY